MTHQKSVEAREVGVVAFADDAVEGPVILVGCLICKLDCKAVEGVEVVACDQGAGIEVPEVLDSADFLDDELLVPDEVVDKPVGKLECHLCLCLFGYAALEIVDVIRHEHGCRGIVLNILVEASGSLVFLYLLENCNAVCAVTLLDYLEVVVLFVGFLDSQIQKISVSVGIALLLFVAVVCKLLEDLGVDSGLFGILVEDVCMRAGIIVPGLVEHDVMQDLCFLDRIGDDSEDLGVPSLVQKQHVVLAQQVQVVLVLCDDAVVDLKDLDEALQDVALAEGPAVDQEHSCIEVKVPVQAETFLDVSAVLVNLDHCLLVACSEDIVADVGIEELCHIALNDGIAVDVDGLVILGMHVGDEEPEVGSLGVVVPERELVGYGLQIIRDILEVDLKAIALQPFGLDLALRSHIGVQEVDPVCAALSLCILAQRVQGDYSVFEKTLVQSVEDRDYLIGHFLTPLIVSFSNCCLRTRYSFSISSN